MFRLASLLGKTVREIECTMSINELEGWAEFLSREPNNSVEIQLALLTTVVANMMGGKKKIDDFLITEYKPPKENIFAEESQVKSIFSFISK